MFPSTMTITCTQNKATSLLSDLHLHRRKHEYMQVWNFRVQRLCKVFVFPKYPPVREYSTHSRVFLIQHYRNILRLSNYETCFYLYISILCLLAVRRLHVRFLLRFKQSISKLTPVVFPPSCDCGRSLELFPHMSNRFWARYPNCTRCIHQCMSLCLKCICFNAASTSHSAGVSKHPCHMTTAN